MKKWSLLACTVCAISLAGCDKPPLFVTALVKAVTPAPTHNGKKIDVAEWTEETKLFDGRTVVVWRKATAYSGGFPNASRGSDVFQEFRYDPLGITWIHEVSSERVRDPVAFEILDGVPYLVVYVGDNPEAFCQSKLPTQYLAQFLRWNKGQWVEVQQDDFPTDKALLNLHARYWGHTAKDDAKGLIRLEVKRTAGEPDSTVKSYFEGFHRTCALHQKK